MRHFKLCTIRNPNKGYTLDNKWSNFMSVETCILDSVCMVWLFRFVTDSLCSFNNRYHLQRSLSRWSEYRFIWERNASGFAVSVYRKTYTISHCLFHVSHSLPVHWTCHMLSGWIKSLNYFFIFVAKNNLIYINALYDIVANTRI